MGIFDFFKRKEKESAAENTPLSYLNRSNLMGSRRSKFFQLPDRANLIEIVSIISNQDPQVAKDFTLLINDHETYYLENQEWCENNSGDFSQGEDILLHTAYWLAGYDNDCTYGAYIDWKEATEDILWQLNKALTKLKYPIDLEKITFSGKEYTHEALAKINEFILKEGYTLTTLDTYSDSYHLYIIPASQYEQLSALGESIGLDFSNNYTE